jgi:hypothetical protein
MFLIVFLPGLVTERIAHLSMNVSRMWMPASLAGVRSRAVPGAPDGAEDSVALKPVVVE